MVLGSGKERGRCSPLWREKDNEAFHPNHCHWQAQVGKQLERL
jgi:hypothetical protein